MKRDCLFANCISLGYACATTQAMKVNGLRSCSGPFDWVISRFSSVLKIVEDDFADYLQKKNLETAQGKATEFYDKKYGFYYMHDIEESFDSEYEKVVSKYSRRITAFRKMVVHPTVFFRTVMNNDEIRFINENREYIEAVIKKLNNNSEIFFFTTSDADNISWGTSFRLSIKNWDGEKFWGHWIFPQKVHEVVKTLISPTQRKESIAFFLNHITPKDALGITLGLAKNNYAFRNIFSDFFREGCYIWGAGHYGKELYTLLNEKQIRIQGFIDNSAEKAGKTCEGAVIYSWNEISGLAPNIFLAVDDVEARKAIKEQIKGNSILATVFDASDLLKIIPFENMLNALLEPFS